MKNNIIIHIGLAKTATTTLQRGLFSQLHNKGLINYIGKTSNWKNELNNLKENEIAYQSIMDYVVFNKIPLVKAEDIVKENILNVFSEEMLSTTLFWQIKKSIPSDPCSYPEKIAEYFRNYKDRVTILLTLRNPVSQIYSAYTQSYRYFINDYNVNTIHNFIGFLLNKKHLFNNFYYDHLLESWSKVFKQENIKILFFEDFINDKDYYYQQLSDLISIPKDMVEHFVADAHFNQKEKDIRGYYNQLYKYSLSKNWVVRSFKKSRFYMIYTKLINKYPNNYISILRNKIVYKKVCIPYLTVKQKKVIFDEFYNSNQKLAEKFKIDSELLRKYNYI